MLVTPSISPRPDPLMASVAKIGDITALASEAGIERVHVLAWRDLVDIEAGGSELHAARVLSLWAEAGLDVSMRTSYAQGHPYVGQRDGYRIVRKHGRFMVGLLFSRIRGDT